MVAIWNTIWAYKKPLGAVLGCIGAILLLLYVLQGIDSCRTQSDLNKKQKNINALTDQLHGLNANIVELQKQEALVGAEVNIAIKERDEAIEQTNEGIRDADDAGRRADNTRKRDFNGTTAANARRAQCIAYPDSCQSDVR
jgi:TolA-binding protein